MTINSINMNSTASFTGKYIVKGENNKLNQFVNYFNKGGHKYPSKSDEKFWYQYIDYSYKNNKEAAALFTTYKDADVLLAYYKKGNHPSTITINKLKKIFKSDIKTYNIDDILSGLKENSFNPGSGLFMQA